MDLLVAPEFAVQVGEGGTLLRAGLDAARWRSVPAGTTNRLCRVRWLSGQFLVVDQHGVLDTSPEGVQFCQRESSTNLGQLAHQRHG